MKKPHLRLLQIFIVCLVILVLGLYAFSLTIHNETTVYFGFQNYPDSYVTFDPASATWTNTCRIDDMWYYDNFGFQVEDGNLTVTDLFSGSTNVLDFEVDAPTGTTSSTRIYTSTKGEPKNISPSTSVWNYNSTTGIFTINGTHSSPIYYSIDWANPSAVTNNTYYQRNSTHTVNTVLGYLFNETQGSDVSYTTLSAAGDLPVNFGWRVYIVNNLGNETEVTSDIVGISSRFVDGAGIQNVTWSCPLKHLLPYEDSLAIRLYMRVGAGAWTYKARYLTDSLDKAKLLDSTWLFSTYTNRTFDGVNTIAGVYWGDATVNTAVCGVTFQDADIYDLMNHKLKHGDFIGFVLAPYLNLVGNVFYGLVMLIICVPIYRRYQSFTPILVLFFIMGGITGFIGLLIPQAATGLAWIFFLFGLAGLLYKVFR